MVKKIRLVEQDPDIREVVTYILEKDGYLVQAMPTIRSIDMVYGLEPQLLLIDERFSDSPGYRLCLTLRALDGFSHISIIVFSTANDIERIVKECGADDYVRKPFDLTELLTKVHARLD